VHAYTIQFSNGKRRVILIYLPIYITPFPSTGGNEATPLLHNSSRSDSVAGPLSPNYKSSNMKAVKGEH